MICKNVLQLPLYRLRPRASRKLEYQLRYSSTLCKMSQLLDLTKRLSATKRQSRPLDLEQWITRCRVSMANGLNVWAYWCQSVLSCKDYRLPSYIDVANLEAGSLRITTPMAGAYTPNLVSTKLQNPRVLSPCLYIISNAAPV